MIKSPQAARVFAKLQRRSEKYGMENQSIKKNGTTDDLAGNEMKNNNGLTGVSQALSSHQNVSNREDEGKNHNKRNSSFVLETAHSKACEHTGDSKDTFAFASSRECHECSGSAIPEDPFLRLGPSHCDPKNLEREATNLVIEDDVQKHHERLQLPSSRESTGSHGSSSSKGDNESNAAVECEVQWEDLQLGEEIGQGNHFLFLKHILWWLYILKC